MCNNPVESLIGGTLLGRTEDPPLGLGGGRRASPLQTRPSNVGYLARRHSLLGHVCRLPPDVSAHNILQHCQPLAGQMPCPRLEASTWPAKEDLDTTGGRGSRVHNRLAVVIGAGSLAVEVATGPSLVRRSGDCVSE